MGNKAYGTKEVWEYITSKESAYAIPPKSNAQNHGNVIGGLQGTSFIIMRF